LQGFNDWPLLNNEYINMPKENISLAANNEPESPDSGAKKSKAG
jgi:hypothetical protein